MPSISGHALLPLKLIFLSGDSQNHEVTSVGWEPMVTMSPERHSTSMTEAPEDEPTTAPVNHIGCGTTPFSTEGQKHNAIDSTNELL